MKSCFGTDQFFNTSKICKKCELHDECKLAEHKEGFMTKNCLTYRKKVEEKHTQTPVKNQGEGKKQVFCFS